MFVVSAAKHSESMAWIRPKLAELERFWCKNSAPVAQWKIFHFLKDPYFFLFFSNIRKQGYLFHIFLVHENWYLDFFDT